MSAVWIGARLPQAPDWVYLDATGLSIGSVHHAEKEQDMIPRRKARVNIRLSQVGIANESDQVS